MTVYARLYSLINGVWQYTDYTYTEVGHARACGAHLSHAGQHADRLQRNLYWTAGSGVTKYEFQLGTTGPGSDNLYYSGLSDRPFLRAGEQYSHQRGDALRPALLADQRSLAVHRLHLHRVGHARACGAHLPHGRDGASTLTGPSVTFSWTAGGGVTEYQLRVGTSVFSDNLLLLKTTALSSGVVNLPFTSRTEIYVELYSLVDGAWQSPAGYTFYTFEAQ